MADDRPRFPIRRFDVFADYQRVVYESRGMPEDRAKGRGIWAAKVVAGRGGRGGAPVKEDGRSRDGERAGREREAEEDDEFRSLGGVQQTDATFDKEIVDRMGQEFYASVFHPAIVRAYHDGKRYEEIRDLIRKDWK